ncbi:LamG-like jellyroll fold domain-containing protein [Limnoglobus roseus]|uniref:LamG-like jellyroll fold domain-containing protein n=1 Tax=Limnoglobus roseus TaxID=2598579 RepID=A0A5C1AH72_9BACT|nr:LamG-like jellyroll fold domain-containing protein [Limnoglobus roseus]QEL16308.1 hypothetical protein PX52LOC_03252 [Limnoglobus roseus]
MPQHELQPRGVGPEEPAQLVQTLLPSLGKGGVLFDAHVAGNARQEIKLHWGKPDATGESDGRAVFSATNGHLSVWHMADAVRDEVGTLESKDTGTTPVTCVVGRARRFPGQKGVFGGDRIEGYPVGAAAHTTEAWFRAERPNGTVIGWGNEQGQGKVVMQYRSPPHVRMDCYFSGGDVAGTRPIPLGAWTHVVHTYEKGESRVYVNGALDGMSKTASAPLNVRTPARLFLGGWYHNYDFVGDIDEVRVSNVARSAEWVRLQYENQKAAQTLVGPVVQAGDTFSVSDRAVSVAEGKSVTLAAKAGGAQKVYWIVTRDGKDTVAATDRFTFTVDAGRLAVDATFSVTFKAVYPTEVKSETVAVTVREAIPEPAFTLASPAGWDGRSPLELVPRISNADAMRAAGADKLSYAWDVSGVAVVKDLGSGKLVLRRSQNSGRMTVRVAVDTGGPPTVRTVTIPVQEPATDPWIARTPGKDEKPEEGQFYPRDDRGEGTLHYNGTLPAAADSVFLRVYADGRLIDTVTQRPTAERGYAFTAKLKPGLVKYKVEFGTKAGDATTTLDTVANLVCGDAYVIDGQSNAESTDVGKDDPPFTSEWIRSFGHMTGDPVAARKGGWGNAVIRDRKGGQFQIGYWGMELARRLVEGQKVPVCIVNGAVGGSRIDAHQRNPADPTDAKTIYGRLLGRVRQAKLTHGIRAVFWHQGENDQGADGPTGGYGYETYQQDFVDLAAGWKTDYPNVQHYYAFQIWPRACAMGVKGSDNRLREVQRNLPKLFSRLDVMSTVGIVPAGGCHFPPAGYAAFARLIGPLVERDHYGKAPTASITAPNLVRAYFSTAETDVIVLEFDQPVIWENKLADQFHLSNGRGKVTSGASVGNRLTLKLTAPTASTAITYLDSAAWSPGKLLRGENGIAALTFCDVPISPAP